MIVLEWPDLLSTNENEGFKNLSIQLEEDHQHSNNTQNECLKNNLVLQSVIGGEPITTNG